MKCPRCLKEDIDCECGFTDTDPDPLFEPAYDNPTKNYDGSDIAESESLLDSDLEIEQELDFDSDIENFDEPLTNEEEDDDNPNY